MGSTFVGCLRFGLWSVLLILQYTLARSKCASNIKYRTLDGKCNNLFRPKWGAVRTPMFQKFTPVYPSPNAVNPRLVSNIVCKEPFSIPNRRKMSELVTFFGQFLDHTFTDINMSNVQWPIPIPPNDPVFKRGTIPFFRSVKLTDQSGDRKAPMNTITSFIDASSVYGSNEATSNKLRLHKGGRLRLVNNLLPRNNAGFFQAGDHRVNENPSLIAIHTLFAREHNRVAAEVAKVYPERSDDFIFSLTRHIVAAEMQAVVYYEFIPAVLGQKLPPYNGYNPNKIGAISVEFSTAAFRVGHTLVNSFVTSISKGNTVRRRRLRNAFFKPNAFLEDTMDGLFRGMVHVKAAEIDNGVVSELRDALFTAESPMKLDLVALNIQRGRDHGMPSYNVLRQIFGLPRAKQFSDITNNPVLQKKLKNSYGSVNKVDAWVGGICEEHSYGSVGNLFGRIWIEQFMRLRDGDRFYFEKRGLFTDHQLCSIPTLESLLGSHNRLGHIMKRIILQNTGLHREDIPKSPFFAK